MSLTVANLTNATDTWVYEARSSANYGDGTRLRVRSGSGVTAWALVYFAKPWPVGMKPVIAPATLRIRQIDDLSGTRTLTVRRITTPWNVGHITYAGASTLLGVDSDTVSVTKTGSPAGTLWEFDVTALMQAAADGAPYFGFRIETTDTNLLSLYSSQAAENKPTLSVTWSDAPHAPTGLQPDVGAASSEYPLLRFDFEDDIGNTSLYAVQVQASTVNTTAGWAASEFDSGTVLTNVPQLDLSAGPFPSGQSWTPLAVGGSIYWRVRVQGSAGVWSDWSDGAVFSYQPKDTVAITNPAVAPDNFVSEPTPPIMWTFTGTQTRYRVWIDNTTTAPTKRVWDTGNVTGTETTVTVPAGVINDGDTYTLGVRVWDDVERAESPGDPLYSVDTRDFTFQLSTDTAPTTGLTGVDLAPLPAMQLTWTRSTAPDSFSIWRNSRQVAVNVPPEDLLVSGTTYRYVDTGPPPRRPHTWQIRANVNGKTSENNPVFTGSISPTGIWLGDPDRDLWVQMFGTDSGTWAHGETAEVYTPVGGIRVVRVTQALRGLEGSISGDLVATDGASVTDAENTLYRMKENPAGVYQLVLADLSLQVLIGNLTIAPTPSSEITRTVSLDFWEVGGLPFAGVA